MLEKGEAPKERLESAHWLKRFITNAEEIIIAGVVSLSVIIFFFLSLCYRAFGLPIILKLSKYCPQWLIDFCSFCIFHMQYNTFIILVGSVLAGILLAVVYSIILLFPL